MNYENFQIGTKVESLDKHGYPVMNLCGTIEKHLGGGHAIIKNFEGVYYSTNGSKNKVFEIISL